MHNIRPKKADVLYNGRVRMPNIAIAVVAALAVAVSYSAAHAVTFVQGASLSSSNFRVVDSQHAGFKASSSSDSYRLLSTIGDIAIGSSSATSFGLRSGFLYYPLIIAPTLNSATAGDAQVTLTWAASTMDAGWTVSGYNVCTKPSASSYTCEDVGDVTTFVKSGLTNGTNHTFKVQAKETFGDVVAESGELSASPTAAPTPTPTPTPPPGGGGGGGGGFVPAATYLNVVGYAYPGATITIMRDGEIVGTTTGSGEGTFSYVSNNMSAGSYIFGFWAEDTAGRRSVILSVPVTLGGGATHVRNIVIAPTIQLTSADSIEAGESISIAGAATPNSRVRIKVGPTDEEFTTTSTGFSVGTYTFSLATTDFEDGEYDISARTELTPGLNVSSYSQLIPFGVGVPAPEITCSNQPDINRDGKVNLVDFSILAYWWKRTASPTVKPFDLNCDDKVQLDDFSILAYHWTG
jgi:hypothetical protein